MPKPEKSNKAFSDAAVVAGSSFSSHPKIVLWSMGSWKSGLANALTTRPTPQLMKPLDEIQRCGMIEKNAEIATPVLRPRVLFGWQNALPVMLELGHDSSPLSELNQLLSRESARGGLAEPSFMCGCRTRVQLVCNTASRPNKWVRLRAPPKKDQRVTLTQAIDEGCGR